MEVKPIDFSVCAMVSMPSLAASFQPWPLGAGSPVRPASTP